MKAAVEGEEVPLEMLSEITDWSLVCKVSQNRFISFFGVLKIVGL
jgi:hypothetical protein